MTDAHVALQLFPGYTEADTEIFAEFLNPNARPEPGFLVDFLGSRIRKTSVWKEARALEGQVIGPPVPADFHAEAVEWIGLLKAVRSANGQYVAMELGAGFGPWVIAGAVAARLLHIEQIRLCAVEGDPQHFAYLRQHFTDNDFDPDQHLLIEAVVGVQPGVARWPILDPSVSTESWGCRPICSQGDYMGRSFQGTKSIEVVPLKDLVLREPIWDLIHIDVQGDEVDICRSCIDELNARVRWMIVATHSRKIDGDLLELMCRAGWFLEHEKPAKFSFLANPTTLEAMTTVDGTQVWRNLRLIRTGDRLTSFSQEITSAARHFAVKALDTYLLDIEAKNTSTQTWFGDSQIAPVKASYRWVDKEGHFLPTEGERSPLGKYLVPPGDSCKIELRILAPAEPGKFELWVSMVQEGVAWFCDRGTKPLVLQVTVTQRHTPEKFENTI